MMSTAGKNFSGRAQRASMIAASASALKVV
jgi:hypothetical protein